MCTCKARGRHIGVGLASSGSKGGWSLWNKEEGQTITITLCPFAVLASIYAACFFGQLRIFGLSGVHLCVYKEGGSNLCSHSGFIFGQ